jgi:predicted RNase H-like HicB family nuclease/DNA-binding XRE family transcriptional regulator
MKYHFKVHKEKKGGYWAHCLEKGMGVTTQGETMEELRAMILEALDLAMDEPMDSDWIPPEPDPTLKGRNVIEVGVSPKIALASMIRTTRLKAGLTQKQVAEKMGIKTLSTYQKLEASKTANPEWLTIVRLKQALPEFPLELCAA